MPLDIAAGLTALTLGIRSINGVSNATTAVLKWLEENKDSDAGRFYYRVQEYLDQRRIISNTPIELPLSGNDPESVVSPNVQKLLDLLGGNEKGEAHPTGVVYVLYDKKGNGKSHAAKALLREFFEFEDGQTLRGIMFTQEALNDNIPEALCSELGASSVDGWIRLLLLAMNKQPASKNYPSILVLDSFNSVGEEGINAKFVKALYEHMGAEMNIYVVVLTQSKEVAAQLFKENGGARIIPLPGSMDGTVDSPEWKEEQWTLEQLVEYVHYKHPNAYTDDEIKAFVSVGMTPLDVNKTLTSKGTLHAKPGSPRKKRRKGGK